MCDAATVKYRMVRWLKLSMECSVKEPCKGFLWPHRERIPRHASKLLIAHDAWKDFNAQRKILFTALLQVPNEPLFIAKWRLRIKTRYHDGAKNSTRPTDEKKSLSMHAIQKMIDACFSRNTLQALWLNGLHWPPRFPQKQRNILDIFNNRNGRQSESQALIIFWMC